MIKLYTVPSSTSSRKARAWLEDNNLEFIERQTTHEPFSKEEILEILSLTEDGFSDIISSRSKATVDLVKSGIINDDLTVSGMIKVIQDHPRILKMPIIISRTKICVGYNEDLIRRFLPRSVRLNSYTQIGGN